MNANEYQKQATRTDLQTYSEPVVRIVNLDILKLVHYGMGLCTESAEFVDMLKKHLMYGKKLDLVNLREELGDLCWYMARAASALDTTLEEIMATNNAKLKARFPEKFTEELAQTRDLNAERQILEGG